MDMTKSTAWISNGLPSAGRHLLLVALCVGLIWLYGLVLVYAFGYAATLRIPSWWSSMFGHGSPTLWLWFFPLDVVTSIVISAPFAWLMARAYGRWWLLAAAVVAGFWAGAELIETLKVASRVPDPRIGYEMSVFVRTLVVLPLLTWFAWRTQRHRAENHVDVRH